jgi:hypothetical protein
VGRQPAGGGSPPSDFCSLVPLRTTLK